MRPSQGFWGTRAFVSGEQENKGLKIRGIGEQRQFWGTGNIENQDFVFEGIREQVPAPPPPGWPRKCCG